MNWINFILLIGIGRVGAPGQPDISQYEKDKI
jgi:hypothetical protein